MNHSLERFEEMVQKLLLSHAAMEMDDIVT